MRFALWLSIATFTSALYWERLLDPKELIWTAIVFVTLCFIPRLRLFAVIPITIIYISLYNALVLTGRTPLPILDHGFSVQNSQSLAHYVDKKDHSIIVEVKSLINKENKGYFRGRLKKIDNIALNYPPIVEIRWYKADVMLQDGQIIKIKGRFKPIYGRGNPAGFDRQKWLYSEHVGYKVSIRKLLKIVDPDVSFRASLYLKVKRTLDGFDNKGVLLALSFADKSLISFERKETIKRLGISHLFAISGLHIGLFFGFIYFLINIVLVRLLPSHYLGWFSWRLVNMTALSAALFYAYLAGFSLPTQRAFLMLFFAVVILSMKRKVSVVDLIGLTLFLVLLYDPLAVLGLSLWLSFLAVSIIIFIMWAFKFKDSAESEEKIRHKVIRYIKGLTFIQLGISFLMLPMQIASFAALNLLAPIVNLLAIPLFSMLIIPSVLLGAFLALLFSDTTFSYLAHLLFVFADNFITLFFTVATFAQHYYQSISYLNGRLIIFAVSLLISGIIAYAFFYQKRKITLIYFSCLLLLFALLSNKQMNRDLKQWQIEIIDVGQGLSVLIRSQGDTLLYDTGPRYPSGFTTASVEIVPYLQSLGISQLDYLVISHSDSDHAGGFDVINSLYKPKHTILGERLKKNRTDPFNAKLCSVGDSWHLGTLTVHVLSPLARGKNNNNNSCVLQISDDKFSILLTGDIDKKQEKELIGRYGDALKSDLLFAPHHGSKHSSSEIFIKRVNPENVVFSTGFLNHWGFPAQKTQERYKRHSVNMINSGESGFIRFTVTDQAIKIETYREDLSPYWYHHLQ